MLWLRSVLCEPKGGDAKQGRVGAAVCAALGLREGPGIFQASSFGALAAGAAPVALGAPGLRRLPPPDGAARGQVAAPAPRRPSAPCPDRWWFPGALFVPSPEFRFLFPPLASGTAPRGSPSAGSAARVPGPGPSAALRGPVPVPPRCGSRLRSAWR